MGVKLTFGALTLAIGASIVASQLVPNLVDPEQALARCAKKLVAGPSSAEDAKKIKQEFHETMRAYLTRFGSDKPAMLTAALQKILPSSAFEVHVSELPRGLKVVEIDTLLQASDYVVMKTNNGVKVFYMPEMEVFDDARILVDSAGPVLAMLGHSGGQPPHRPQLRTYALLPDFLSDETEKLVPPLSGEGTARFDKNGQDVKVELSLTSAARNHGITIAGAKDEIIHETLEWKDARYLQAFEQPSTAGGVLFVVAQALRHPEFMDAQARLPGSAALQLAKTNAAKPADPMRIVITNGKKDIEGDITAGSSNYQVNLQGTPGSWLVSKIRTNNTVAVASPTDSAHEVDQAAAANVPAPAQQGAPVVTATTHTSMSSSATRPNQVVSTAQPASDARRHIHLGASANGVGGVTDTAVSQITGSAPTTPDRDGTHKRRADTASTATSAPAASHESARSHVQVASNISAASINLRARPSLNGRKLNDLPRGTALELISKADGWYKVRYQGQVGYVFAPLVDSGHAGSVPEPVSAPSHASTTAVSHAAEAPTHRTSESHRPERHRHVASVAPPIVHPVQPAPATGRHRHGRGIASSHNLSASVEAPQLVP